MYCIIAHLNFRLHDRTYIRIGKDLNVFDFNNSFFVLLKCVELSMTAIESC